MIAYDRSNNKFQDPLVVSWHGLTRQIGGAGPAPGTWGRRYLRWAVVTWKIPFSWLKAKWQQSSKCLQNMIQNGGKSVQLTQTNCAILTQSTSSKELVLSHHWATGPDQRWGASLKPGEETHMKFTRLVGRARWAEFPTTGLLMALKSFLGSGRAMKVSN